EGQSHGFIAPSSSKSAASAEYTAWTTSDTRFKQSLSSIPEDLHMDDDSAPDEQVHSSDDEDIRNDHIPKVNLMQDWWKSLSKEDTPATPEPTWSIPSSDLPVLINNWASALASTYAPPPENSLLAQIGDMATFMDWYCKQQGIIKLKQEDLEGPAFKVDDALIRYNVSKPLPLSGQPGQVIIQTDFFFNKDLEYLGFGSKGGRLAFSISKMKAAYYPDVGLEIEVLFLYGYDYIKKIVLRIADLKEYIIAKRDFKYLYPSDFEDLDKYGVQMIMRFNEIHKFSDGTLHQIDEALDYRVKRFKVNRINLGLNTRFWTRKDMDRSKEFMFSIQKRLKTRKIFRNLESFVGGRLREGDYRLLHRTE
nr:hypothetical protein [Tanacetum cinerariifolium]